MENNEREKIEKMMNEMFDEASQGFVNIGEREKCWRVYSRFYVDIEGNDNTQNRSYQTLHIPNKKEFVDSLNDYLKTARVFYSEDKWYYDVDEQAFDKNYGTGVLW